MTKFQVEEIRFDLKHCQIAAKWWGSKKQRPILMVHGWQDNAGSFDTLIPLLPSNFSYLAIDLPGHGFSSHLPEGINYHQIDFVHILEQIRLKFKWKRLSIIGHSMGAIITFFYAAIFPDNVDMICALDTIKIQSLDPKLAEKIYLWRTKKLMELNGNVLEQPPEYTYDELVQRVYEGSMRSVEMDKAKYMIEHGAKQSPTNENKLYFTRDFRLKYMQLFHVEHKIGLAYIKHIRAPYLFIRSEDRIFSEPEKHINEAIDTFRRHNKRFELLRVGGTHHVHLNSPELMAGKIGEFVKKYYTDEVQQSDNIGLKSKL